MNVELRKLQEELVNVINASQSPTEAKRLVVCEVLHKLEAQANKEIAYEIQKRNEEKESERE